jgi:hypothetical protein
MIDVAGSFTLGTILVFVLLIWRKSSAALRDLPMDLGPLTSEAESCPQEFVARIFSREDASFVDSTCAATVRALFLRERKGVALLWIRQTSLRIRNILREHTMQVRHSENLHFQSELGIFARYLQLRALCGLMFAAVALTGPIHVRKLALRMDTLFQRFVRIRESLAAPAPAPQLRGAGSR